MIGRRLSRGEWRFISLVNFTGFLVSLVITYALLLNSIEAVKEVEANEARCHAALKEVHELFWLVPRRAGADK